MKIRTTCTCPLEIVHDIMKGKWKTIIVFQLRNGGMGLAELERGIEGITQKMLLQHLGELRAFGLIGMAGAQDPAEQSCPGCGAPDRAICW